MKKKMSLTELAALRGVEKPKVGCSYSEEHLPYDYEAVKDEEVVKKDEVIMAEEVVKPVSTVVLPLYRGKVGANSKRQARVMFMLKNNKPVDDVEIAQAWPTFSDLPELGQYNTKEPFCYSNDHKVVVCSEGIFPYENEVSGVIQREKSGVVVTDGYYLAAIHRGSLVALSDKVSVREYVRRCCTDIKGEWEKYEATLLVESMSDEVIDRFVNQVWPKFSTLPEPYTKGADWHWNDRD